MDSDNFSDSVADDFHDESDAFEPEAPKLKAPAKKATATKAAPAKAKKMNQTTLSGAKPAAKKRPKADSDDDVDDSMMSNTPPVAKKPKKAPAKKANGKPLAEIENDSMMIDDDVADSAQAVSKKSATETYQKLTQLEHIIKRPDTYIGSVERTDQNMWTFDKVTGQMQKKIVSFVPGLYKIFDEVIVNAADQKQREKSMTYLKVTIDRGTGEISVENNGKAIPIEMHDKEKIYIPELIFGHLLTGSNYDDDEKKTVGGRNGYGAKLCNVFSTRFSIEIQDSTNGKRYKQTWTDNMSKIEKAKITSSKSADFVRVTFTPDYKRFGMENGIDDDLEGLLYRRVYDMAGTVDGVKVYLNGEALKLDFKKYCTMYARSIAMERDDPVGEGEKPVATVDFEDPKLHARWKIGFTVSDGTFQQVSFVNSIATTSGGTHVSYIADQIGDALLKDLNKKRKGHSLKLNHIRNHIFIFITCLIDNPAFSSQTKEQMTTKVSAFGSKCVLSEAFLKKIRSTEAINNIMQFADQKADKLMAKSDGNKRSRVSNEKLIEANFAGTRRGHECTLILTEGDSARGLAVAGRAVLDPDRIGVFPLRGKMLNVRDASIDQILKNKEIENIKKFLGLKHKAVYTDNKGLRYGHLMIMADQDHDGSHIKGLLINFLQVQYPSLLKIPGFFQEFITPVVKVWQGSNPKKPTKKKSFFTLPQYEEWKELHRAELRRWDYKYLKGLGSSSNEDAQVYFTALDEHLKEFDTMRPQEADLFELLFSKKKADARKEWLGNFVPGTYLDSSISKNISYEDFVNKELILFSMADNLRSIPSMIDGLKPGQRKVMHGCFKRNLVKDKKVVELAGYISENTAYHHGEQSLQQTIVGLAQTFVGSNNVNCLEPSGNFGSRLSGGSDAASARYIHTRLSPFARKVFNVLDEPNLEYQFDDGQMIEPKVFAPIIPMVLVNGADGIGTGWSTSIPNYHPIDIVNNLKRRMGRLDENDPEGKPFVPMVPWWRGWKGQCEPEGPNRYKFNGLAEQDSHKPNEVVITELPIRMWTDDFKARLEDIIRAEKTPSFIKDYQEFNDHNTVHFVIQMDEKHMKAALEEGLNERFKLNKTVATTNLVAFNSRGQIQKYENPEQILEEFYVFRLRMYQERKAHWLKVHHAAFRKLENQYRFIKEIIDGKLVVSKKKKAVLVQELRDCKYEAFPPKVEDRKSKSTDEEVGAVKEDEDEELGNDGGGARDYDYLLSMAIWSLTLERLEKLKAQIAAKKAEYDELDALSDKDLWCRDLDAFVEEWEAQLNLDREIKTNINKTARRASKKIGAGGGKARRVKDEDDYEPEKKTKARAAPKAPKVETKTAQRFAEMFSGKPKKPKPTPTTGMDGAADDGSDDDDFMSLGKAKSTVKREESIPSIPEPANARAKRAATSKAKTYVLDDEDDDDDFEDLMELDKPSAPPIKAEAASLSDDEVPPVKLVKRAAATKAKPTYLDDEDNDDILSDDVKVEEPVKRAAASKAKPSYLDEDDDGDLASDDEVVPVKTAKRATASKAKPSYIDEDDEEDEASDDDKMLGNIGAMVKGIGAPTTDKGRLSLFAMSRPDSAGEPALPRLKTKTSKAAYNDADSHDDTNYEALALSSPRKSTKADELEGLLSDDDDAFVPAAKLASVAKASSQATGPKAKAPLSVVPAATKRRGRPAGSKNKDKDEKPAAAPKAASKAAAKSKAKTTTLSPMANAYAAKKKAKSRAVLSDDEDEDVEMDDAPPSPVAKPAPARGRPGRAAAAKAKPIIIDDEDESGSDAFALEDDSE